MHVTHHRHQGSHLAHERDCRVAIDPARCVESIERAVRTVERSPGELTTRQPFAIYVEQGEAFYAVAARAIDASKSFDTGGSLAAYLRLHPRPVMPTRSRRGRAMLASLDAAERSALVRLGAIALVPVFELGRLAGFIVVGGLCWDGHFDSVDPVLATELACCLSGAFSRLRTHAPEREPECAELPFGVASQPQPS